ncbi:glucose-6-phosphate isomerase [Mucilaginibacter hurinus]|uniref:glucose-6-phosphate isomerase n=1 Tax=Mucilaginibacter hurinus TaxID=2201324 RepID=A0A367GN16_9SPHI|nr:glucose-6-phosphate isomerase family protein [Mucilaginibacter hurinus]RCH54256.1 glucose-6-phosphate isomerase [Mucilaginibacter hurinus]
MNFDPGFDIRIVAQPLGFTYGNDCFGPEVETRRLNDIRKSLRNPDCNGPEVVYAIAMDVGKTRHKAILEEKMLLYGAVTYAAGKLGDEPVRSQGHIHKKSSHSGWSPPEVYEIWSGAAIIYMQEYAADNPGRCFAVYAGPGDVVVVPPEWAHATISADPATPLTFGAWCDREYGFLYDEVRKRNGLAWFPLVDEDGEIVWQANPNYMPTELVKKSPADYSETLQIGRVVPIYEQFEQDPDKFQFVSQPALKQEVWLNFTP